MQYLVLLFIVIASCKTKQHATPIDDKTKHNNRVMDSIQQYVQTGDILLRRGDDFISTLLADLSPTEQQYSHSGICFKMPDGKMSVLSINPATRTGATDDTVRLEPIDSFVKPAENKRVGLFRIAISEVEKENFLAEIFKYQAAKVRFDMRFNWQDEDKIYCSELIGKALHKAVPTKKYNMTTIEDTKIIGVKRFFKISNEKIDLKKYPILPLDQLYLNDFTKRIFEAELKTARSLN